MMSGWYTAAAGWSAVAACLAVASLVTVGRTVPGRRRLAAIRAPIRSLPGPADRSVRTGRSARFRGHPVDAAGLRPPLVGCATAVGGLLLSGEHGPIAMLVWVAAGGAVAVIVARRRRTVAAAGRARLDVSQAPLAADLLAACVAAGASPAEAAASVARVLDGELAQRFTAVAAALRMGVDPAEAWHPLAADPATAPLARAMARGCRTGAPLADVAGAVAGDLRTARRATTRRATRQAGVLAMAPLGGCFLPAFVLLAVVPMVAGLASRLPL
jgi:Flp pilus assembly protein TadB